MQRVVADRTYQVPDAQRSERKDDAALRPAKGIALGLTVSGAMWVAITALFF